MSSKRELGGRDREVGQREREGREGTERIEGERGETYLKEGLCWEGGKGGGGRQGV